jgi:heme/copper-type cytochrome/quinol oxidase subunit 3
MSGPRIIADLSDLPSTAFGSRTLIWWGVLGFMLIEGGGFALAIGSYLFLMGHTNPWPPRQQFPHLTISTVLTGILLFSELPNVWVKKAAHAQQERKVQIGLVIMSVIGLALIGVRLFEFRAVNCRWDDNAYGSIVWALLFLHTTHLVTDLADTIVLTLFTFTHEVETDRFSDVADNCLYWRFVVLAWLPIYGLIYWLPRLIS